MVGLGVPMWDPGTLNLCGTRGRVVSVVAHPTDANEVSEKLSDPCISSTMSVKWVSIALAAHLATGVLI